MTVPPQIQIVSADNVLEVPLQDAAVVPLLDVWLRFWLRDRQTGYGLQLRDMQNGSRLVEY